MSTIYMLRFDTGNAAFEDYGRDAEVAAVIRRAMERIQRDGLDDDFKVYDTNGNAVGRFSEVDDAKQSADTGEVLLTIETGNAAFEDDPAGPAGEVARILWHAAQRIEQGDWPAGLLDINGNRVGAVDDNALSTPRNSR